jgi:LacI family transcriptional regulator
LVKDLKLKKELGFAGFTNSKVGQLFNPPMTAVKQPAFEIGQIATQLLIEMIESKRPIVDFQTKVLDTELIIRESSLKKE